MVKFRRVSGHHIGKRTRRVYVCDKCGLWHGTKVKQCACGFMAFTHFSSRGEAKQWASLKLLEKLNKITSLRRQVRYPLMAAGDDGAVRVGYYVADFVFTQDGKEIIQDYKSPGAIDPLAAWKLRHMEVTGKPVTLVT